MKHLFKFFLLAFLLCIKLNSSDQAQKESFFDRFMSGWQELADAYAFNDLEDADFDFLAEALDNNHDEEYQDFSKPQQVFAQEPVLTHADSISSPSTLASHESSGTYQLEDSASLSTLSSDSTFQTKPMFPKETKVSEAQNYEERMKEAALQNEVSEQKAKQYMQKAAVLDEDIRSIKRIAQERTHSLEQKILALNLKNESLRKTLSSLEETLKTQSFQNGRKEQKIIRAKGLEDRERQLVVAQLRDQNEKLAKFHAYIADLERELLGERVFNCRLAYQSSLGVILSQRSLESRDAFKVINIMNRLCGCNALFDEKCLSNITVDSASGRIVAILDSFIALLKYQGVPTERPVQLFAKFLELLTTSPVKELGASKGLLAGDFMTSRELHDIVRLLLQLRLEPEDIEFLHVSYKKIVSSD